MVWLGKEKVYGHGFHLVLAFLRSFLLTQCEGKIYKAVNDRFSGVQNDQTLMNTLQVDEMAGRSEISANLLKTPPPSPENSI